MSLRLWEEIERIRIMRHLSERDMCDIFNVTENTYHKMRAYHCRPNNYQLIMFIISTRHHLDGI